MEVDLIGAIAIGLAFLIVSILIIKFVLDLTGTSFLERIKETVSNLYSQIFGKSYYNVCESFNNTYISLDDFETLLNAYYRKRCGDARVEVILSFSVSKDDLKEMAKHLGISKDGKLIIYDSPDPVGIGAIIVDGYKDPNSRFVLKANNRISIWNVGSPEKDVFINITGVDCDPYTLSCSQRPIQLSLWGNPILKNKNRGEICGANSECSGILVCDGGHCCRPEESWNGTDCVFQYTFTILFIPLKERNTQDEFMDEATFREIGNNFRDTWVDITPFQNCPERVRVVFSEYICEIPIQEEICSPHPEKAERTFRETNRAILNCVKNFGYENVYTRVVGVLNKESVCGNYYGYTGGYNYPIVISKPNVAPMGGIQYICSHEMGHTFGLCDEGYGNAICVDCRNGFGGICSFGGSGCFGETTSKQCKKEGGIDCPNIPETSSIMCTLDLCNRMCNYGTGFATSSFGYLDGELGEYCN